MRTLARVLVGIAVLRVWRVWRGLFRTPATPSPVAPASARSKVGVSPHLCAVPTCVDCGGDLTPLSDEHCLACLADIAWLDEPLTAEERAAIEGIDLDSATVEA